MQRPSKAISQGGVRKRAARGERTLRVRSCAVDAIESLVETLEARVFLSVASTNSGSASPIGVVLPITAVEPNSGGLTAPPSLAKTPAQLRGAYGLGQYGASNITFNGVQGDGSGQTIAIIDVYDDPNAVSDLHNFDVAMGLPDPPSFIKVNEEGDQTPANLPGTDPDGPGGTTGFGTWEEEESLDIEYSHAMAPKANLILVECASPNYDDLIAQGVNWARYQPTVSVISMSFGGSEWSGETSYDSYFTTPAGHQGVSFIASTGDSGAYDPGTTTKDVEYPAISPNVLAVGGTRLTLTNGNTGLGWSSEKGWGNGTSSGSSNGGGGGVSTVEAKPSYQIGVVGSSVNGTPTNSHRTIPDISAEADPNAPGVALYDSYDFGASTPWLAGYEGGTSLSAPLVAGMVAVANQGRNLGGLPTFDGPNELLPAIYKLHASSTDYHDITAGNNGFAAATGYDLVTGIGTPIANNLLPDLIATDTAPVISSFTASPNPATTQSTDVVLSVTATNSPTEVDYYIETDGIQGLQSGTGEDTEMAAVTTSAGGFAYHVGGWGPLPNGNFTIYAVAKNSFGVSQPAIVDSGYTAGTGTAPTITSLSASASLTADSSLTLTAVPNDSQGAVTFVNFYRESNGIPGLQVGPNGDTLVGSAASPDSNNSSNWSAITTAPTTAGSYTWYAQSTDDNSEVCLSSADGAAARSVAVTVVAGAATQLAFSVPPANGFAGVTLPALSVQIEDQFGNLITGATSAVALTLNGGSFAAGSTVTVNASGGIATFSNLAINSTGSFTIIASDGALTAVTSPSFTVSALASQVVFSVPPASGVAGATLPVVTVQVEDQFGNLATNDSSAVTLTLNGGSFAAGSTATVNASGGVATFNNLAINSTGSFTVTASDGALTAKTSASFSIAAGAASQLFFSVPPASGFAGETLPAPTVQVEDQFGNLATGDSSAVTLTLSAGAFAAGSTITVNASGGVASFENLAIDSIGSFTITASDGALTAMTSPSFSIAAGAASQLFFSVPPANGFAGVTLPAPSVEVEDQFGNPVIGDTSAVTLTLNGGSFADGSTATVNASGGVAIFNNLATNSTGSFTITASDGTLTAIASPSFSVSPAARLSALVSTSGATTADPGQNFTFTITIANGGQTDVAGAAVSDPIPDGVSKYSFIATDNGQGATGYTASGSGSAIHDTVNLPAGAIITYSVTCAISPTATGALTDTATVSTPSGTLNPIANVNGSTQTNQNSATLTLTPTADSYVAITGGDPLAVGSVDVYTIVVTNNGPSAISGTPGTTGLSVADTFSSLSHATYVSQVLYGTAAGNTQGTSPTDSLTLGDTLTMGVGAIVQYTITGTIAGGAPSTLADTVTLTAPAGTTDPISANNSSTVSAAVSATPTAVVTGRSIFYLDSFYDADNTGAPTTADFNAIAPDKTPLMPGQTARFNNYSGYGSGITGLFIDISGDPNPGNIVPSDFEFIVGNNSTPGTGTSPGNGWSTLATAPTITPFPGQGVNNSNRFALTWPSGTIAGTWVQVTVLADADTGLATPDVFYFGSAPGDGGNNTTDARVNATDESNARNDSHTFFDRASISDPNDFNRDSFVNADDESVARSNSTTFLTALNLISVPGLPNGAGLFAPANAGTAQATPTTASTAGAPGSSVGPSSVATASTVTPISPASAVNSGTAAPLRPTAAAKVVPARSTAATQADDRDNVDNSNLRTRLKSLIRFISPLR